LESVSNCGAQTADGSEDKLGIDEGSEDGIEDGFEDGS
jgi:flagellar biosynthesis/type III secretory pathway protein FliH